MVDETLALLQLWEPGLTTIALKEKARTSGVLGRATAIRVEDIVGRVFASRFLKGNPPPATRLRILLDAGVPWRNLRQVLFLHTARVHDVLADFVTQVYWPKFTADAAEISRQDALDFLAGATATGVLNPPWSDVMMIRVARYLTGCLTEFGFAGPDRAGIRPLLPFRIDELTALYLAHDLHFAGISDASLSRHPDWALFGLEPPDLPSLFSRIGRHHFICQGVGEMIRITWHYRSFEEALRAIAAA